ncbi:aromatic amino acid exporter YddG [Cucumibacter marinus]|uniref:aromatic amino acid exporter YddG n=1 Tax=Cucumibacter marinus TaxID=1121252 RepID=UPI00042094E7|nr:EamA family transporter [Cucumibacter marinus]
MSPATLIGFTAVLMWALLALFTAASGAVPPFQLNAMAFTVATAIGLIFWQRQPGRWAMLRQPWPVWLLGIGGLFGYHFFYFTALRNAPPVEAGLIAYLWPLLIVLFSALLPGEHLKPRHVIGAVLGLFGAALIVTGGQGISFNAEYGFGYLMALVCAFTWSGYSVLSRGFKSVPTPIVTFFCMATAFLSLGCHLALEETVMPADTMQWLAVLGLGLGPVGLAFFVWDHGVKHGDIQLLGTSAYAAPLLSTLILMATGFAPFTWTVLAAALLITIGAGFAAGRPARRKK